MDIFQKNIMLVLLESQLKIERVKLQEIIEWDGGYLHKKLELNIHTAVILEIDRQIKELKTT